VAVPSRWQQGPPVWLAAWLVAHHDLYSLKNKFPQKWSHTKF